MAASEWQVELMKTLDNFVDKEKELIRTEFKAVARETAKDLKQRSPKAPGGGDYAAGWKVKSEESRNSTKQIIYNPKHYQLTHLLEKGHDTFNQFGGPYKRTPAHRHIAPAEEEGVRKLLERMRSKL